MEYKGPSAYDEEFFFNRFLSRRNRADSPNNTMEHPAFIKLLGEVGQKKILDLGCGDARFGVELLKKGCSSYEGVEGSRNMAEQAAESLNGLKGRVFHSYLEEWNYPSAHYDLIVSRMSFHYIEKLEPIFEQIHQALRDNGRFIFSVQHPVLTSSQASAVQSPRRTNWIVDDYFDGGKRVEPWIEEQVVKYHRTLEDYFKVIKASGFTIEDISECAPKRGQLTNEGEYQRRMRIPLFLIIACHK
ncbi:class I SAM-dependent DNA methyltransferase [Halobacillus naozhouensis]|uniref:Methyltransferase domain-containing protein n=1 Tax=Halobacillus naozhouensis TaxID=554880 RepID=A0ABY8J0X9_9BACI|nr:class I SAM-dependent methyltransferase [Halobacillus naozhouensis]WFT75214.1 methyltransferase domain-containing protein [Halobacillus naozhouensis]